MSNRAKVLFIDIETSPMLVYCWGLFDQNIALNQIKQDWHIISVAAKWSDEDEVIQYDLRNGINDKNEKSMLRRIWKLLDEADVVIGQNSKKFDIKKLNEKFLKYGFGVPSQYRQEDTLTMSKKFFAPTSHKLEYRSKNLNKKYKKLEHSKYPGFSLWVACLEGDQAAWEEMATYNKFDVLSTEEYFNILKPWAGGINYNVYSESLSNACNNCGHTNQLVKRGFRYTSVGKYQAFRCSNCGGWTQSKINLLTKEKKDSLREGK